MPEGDRKIRTPNTPSYSIRCTAILRNEKRKIFEHEA